MAAKKKDPTKADAKAYEDELDDEEASESTDEDEESASPPPAKKKGGKPNPLKLFAKKVLLGK